jgi:hypothetical protein
VKLKWMEQEVRDLFVVRRNVEKKPTAERRNRKCLRVRLGKQFATCNKTLGGNDWTNEMTRRVSAFT